MMCHGVKHRVVVAKAFMVVIAVMPSAKIAVAGESGLPTAIIHGKSLDEISGMTNANIAGQYWGHSDSGFAPTIHRFNDRGEVLQSVALDGVSNRDFEAMTQDTSGHMYIADTGDNGLSLGTYQIYQLPAAIPDDASLVQAKRFNFTYEDRNPRNCEAMFAYDGKLYLLTKQEIYNRQPEVFELPIPQNGGNSTAKRLGRMDLLGRVTDVAYSPQHKLVAVLTYHGVAFYDFAGPQDLMAKPKHYTYGSFGKCEAICFDGDSLVITNENQELWKHSVEVFLGTTWIGVTRPKQKLANLTAAITLDGRTDDWPADATVFSMKPERSGASLNAKMYASPQGWHIAVTIPYHQGRKGSRPIGDTLFVTVAPDLNSAFPSADTSVYAITVIDKKQKAKVFRMQQPLPWDGRGDWKSQSSPAGSAALRIENGKLTIEATIGKAYLHPLVRQGNRDVRFNLSLLGWKGKKVSFWSWAGPLRGHGDEKLQSWGTISLTGQ